MIMHFTANSVSYISIVFWILMGILLIRNVSSRGRVAPRNFVIIGFVLLVLGNVLDIYENTLVLRGDINVSTLGILTFVNLEIFILGISFVILSLVNSLVDSSLGNHIKLRWNWLAFIFCPIWSIYHRIWWGLLSLIPFVGMIYSVYMGMYGNSLVEMRRKNSGK